MHFKCDVANITRDAFSRIGGFVKYTLTLAAVLLMASATGAVAQSDATDSGGDKVTPASANGAVVRQVQGGVQADAGTGLSPAVVDQVLPPASRVVVEDAGFTILSFAEGCDLRLEPGDWTVPNPSAATVTEIVGGVQVFQNEAFRPIAANQPVNVGDRILVQAESSALLRFETGCDLRLQPGITEVPSGCQCLTPLMTAGAAAAPALGPYAPWIGGALLGAGTALVLDDSDCNCRPPISP